MAGPGYRPSLSRNRWNSLRMSNRIPAVEMERKMTDIRRFYAHFKRDIRIEEGRIWDYLFENELLLKKSITKNSLEDVLNGKVPLARNFGVKEDPPPYSEVYRQFIIFKALTMAKLFGDRVPKRPKYADLYAKEAGYKLRNDNSVEELFRRLWQEKGWEWEAHTDPIQHVQTLPARTVHVDPQPPQSPPASKSMSKRPDTQCSTATYKSGVIQARPHHTKRYSACSGKSNRPGTDRESSDIMGSVDTNGEHNQVVLPPIGHVEANN